MILDQKLRHGYVDFVDFEKLEKVKQIPNENGASFEGHFDGPEVLRICFTFLSISKSIKCARSMHVNFARF